MVAHLMTDTQKAASHKPAVKLRVSGDCGGKGNGYDSGSWIRSIGLELIEEDQVIGTAELYVFNADGADAADESIYDMCDNHCTATHNCGLAVYKMKGILGK
jgi:hypothetical protein